jgi:tyrosyl-tRNA synthetase
MIHGDTALAKAEQASAVLFGGEMTGLEARDIQDIFAEVPSSELPKHNLEDGGVPVVDLLVQGQLASSKGDARRKIQGGGIYLNNIRITSDGQTATLADALHGQFLVLRQGKKQYHLVKLLA